MEINYVQEYLTLLSVGNYLDAAEEMYTSPASLARHIKKLEEDLGFELFVPQGRSLVPSELAKAFTPFAEEIVHAQERCYNFLDTYQSKKPDMLRVG
ncbi:MAG: LysR family transcriptional regulator, partial [Neglectibacter timonensis]